MMIIIMCCCYYVLLVSGEYFKKKPSVRIEGFAASVDSDNVYKWLDNDELYDRFYAQIYDQLVSHKTRTKMQVNECMTRWKKTAPSDMRILDIGCGTGIACQLFAEKGARVHGIDKSESMIKYAKDQLAGSKLPIEKAKNIEFRVADMMMENSCKSQDFTHATLFYFSVYYAENKAELFKNIHTWVRPGGCLMIEVVNKYKFDPMFQAAAPFIGFSLQKYNKERQNKSKIAFNDFKYEGDFLLLEDGPKSEAAEFREVIEFNKTGVVRRQKHKLWMPEIKEILRVADSTGWIYKGYKDMLPFGFEYAYMLFFEHD